MEQRQDTLLTFLKKTAHNPDFVEHLAQKLESIDFSVDNKKSRLPKSRVFPYDGVVENHSHPTNKMTEDQKLRYASLSSCFVLAFKKFNKPDMNPTILQISSAIHHLSNIDNMYIKSYSFSLFSSLPGVLTPVRGESLKILNGFDVSLPVSHSLWSSQSFGHQKAINGFDMPLPVAVCSGLVNPLAPRKGKFHGGLITMSTLYT
ncbi:hypothetical protein Tco_0706567 [Tanacetum coccineum]|uniref:Uncharacterized protein n=1 Tax=Tanacetum coccineum TaxID=301880 RepID=A0ABQ4Y9C0_9ASTR